jgi:REP element-mobilizing transposase RayT
MDISIKQLSKEIDKNKKDFYKKVNEFLNSSLSVEEKIDGTKLILIRNDSNDSVNPTNNWIVSYKGNVLYNEEFEHLSDHQKENIRNYSISILQYALVFDHIKNINFSVIPQNTAFSVEFAQNKDTLTRTYHKKHDLFLRSFASVSYYINDGFLTMVSKEEITDRNQIEIMSKRLNMCTFPIWLNGKINNQFEFLKSIKNKNLLEIFQTYSIDYNNPIDVFEKFIDIMLKIPSSLGGITEGVVVKTNNGTIYKITQEDQYDKSVRNVKKELYRMDENSEKIYNQSINIIRDALFKRLDFDKPLHLVLKQYNVLASNQYLDIIYHNKKSYINKLDDLILVGKFKIQQHFFIGNCKTLGVIAIAGKPIHVGHWKLIQLASQRNERVLVYLSEKDRINKNEFPIYGKQTVQIWNEVYKKYLPPNVKFKFVDSPVGHVRYLMEELDNNSENAPNFTIYSDDVDITDYKIDELKIKFPRLLSLNKLTLKGISRKSLIDISGTHMRELIRNGNIKTFFSYLPPELTTDECQYIWNILNQS